MNIECTAMGKPVLISKLQDRCYSITVYRCRALLHRQVVCLASVRYLSLGRANIPFTALYVHQGVRHLSGRYVVSIDLNLSSILPTLAIFDTTLLAQACLECSESENRGSEGKSASI